MKKSLITLSLAALCFISGPLPAWADNLEAEMQEEIRREKGEKPALPEVKPVEPSKPDPALAALLATLFPGGGYFYQGDYLKGGFSAALAVPLLAPAFVKSGNKNFDDGLSLVNELSSLAYIYTVYDSYHSAVELHGRDKMVVAVPHYSLGELYLAPFDPRSYTDNDILFYVSAGLNIAAPLAATVYNISTKGVKNFNPLNLLFLTLLSISIGVFEEAFARGTVLPAVAQVTGKPWLANIIQSAHFGLLHTEIGNKAALVKTPFITAMPFYLASPYWKPEQTSNSAINNINNDPLIFVATGLIGYLFGAMVEHEENGLLKTVTHHTFRDLILLAGVTMTTPPEAVQPVTSFSLPVITLSF